MFSFSCFDKKVLQNLRQQIILVSGRGDYEFESKVSFPLLRALNRNRLWSHPKRERKDLTGIFCGFGAFSVCAANCFASFAHSFRLIQVKEDTMFGDQGQEEIEEDMRYDDEEEDSEGVIVSKGIERTSSKSKIDGGVSGSASFSLLESPQNRKLLVQSRLRLSRRCSQGCLPWKIHAQIKFLLQKMY